MQLRNMEHRKGTKHEVSEYIEMANNKQNIYRDFFTEQPARMA
jgi:hypothetical protein